MPHYRYRHTHGQLPECRNESEFDTIESMSAVPYRACPSCGKPVERVIFAGQRPLGGDTPIHH